MSRFRPAVLLAAIALAGGLTAGCSTTDSNGASPSTATAKSELHDAAKKLGETTSKLQMQLTSEATSTVPSGLNVSGNLDPKGGTSSLSMTVSTLSFEMRLLPDAIYMKFNGGNVLPGVPPGWMKLDRARIPSGLSESLKPDAAMGADKFVSAIETADKTGTGEYSGTINVGKVAGSIGLPTSMVSLIPEADRMVPFTASVNPEGYLTKLTISPKFDGKTTTMTMMFSGFGQPVDIPAPPANEVTDAPELIYTALAALG